MKRICVGNLIVGISLGVYFNIVSVDTSKLVIAKPYSQVEENIPLEAPKIPLTDILPSIDEYIIKKFPERPREALATFKHENGYQLRNDWKADVVGRNTDGSKDIGIAMINSVNWNKCGGEEALKDPYKNIDCARKLYDERVSWGLDGLSAWYSYVFDKYLMFM